MYVLLNGYKYEIKNKNIKLTKNKNNTYTMFIEIYAVYYGNDLDNEIRSISLYQDYGFDTLVDNLNDLKRKEFRWDHFYNNKNEEAGILYVLEHEAITSSIIKILNINKDKIKIEWTGKANIFWNDVFGRNVPFKTSFETTFEISIN